jgi:predicted ABC-type ATPase
VPDAPNKFDKRAIIILGPPASGKSSIANPIARKHGAAIIDADEAKKLLPEFHNGAGANAVHKESKELAEVLQVQAIDDGLNVVIPTVGSKPEVIRKLIKKFKDSGYNVDLVGMDVSYTNARNRMLMRFVGEGRYIPLDYIQSIGNKPLEVYNVLRKEGLADGFTQIDNNGKFGDAKPVLEDTRGLLEGVELRLREGRRGSDGAAQDATRSREVQSPEANAQEEFIGRLNKADDAFANLERGNLPDDPVGSTQTRPAPQETAIQAKDVDDAVEQVSRDTDFENMPDDEILVLDEVIDDQVVARSYTGAEIKAELAQDQQMLDRLRGCVV